MNIFFAISVAQCNQLLKTNLPVEVYELKEDLKINCKNQQELNNEFESKNTIKRLFNFLKEHGLLQQAEKDLNNQEKLERSQGRAKL